MDKVETEGEKIVLLDSLGALCAFSGASLVFPLE